MTLTDRHIPEIAALTADGTVRRQIASATQRLRRYRLARDRARLNRQIAAGAGGGRRQPAPHPGLTHSCISIRRRP